MKKILFLLLVTIASYGQTYQNPTFGTIKTKTAPTVTNTPHLGTVETDGTISKITPENLPVSTATQDSIDTKIASNAGLQNAYNFEPWIITSDIKGAVTVQRGSASDTDNIIVGKNGAGTTTFSVSGSGVIDLANISLNSTNGFITKNGQPFIHNFYAAANPTGGTGNNLNVGYDSGNFNSDNKNYASTMVGFESGKSNKNGYSNTGVGYYALRLNENGYGNTALGTYVLGDMVNGNANTSTGWHSSLLKVSGNYNSIYGVETMQANTIGSFNTAFGANSGYNNITGSSNVFLGYAAGLNELGSNKLYISNSSTNDPLIKGDFSTGELELNAGLTSKLKLSSPQVTLTALSTGGTYQDFNFNAYDYRFLFSGTQKALFSDLGYLALNTTSANSLLHLKQPVNSFTGGIKLEAFGSDTQMNIFYDGTSFNFDSTYGSTGSYSPIKLRTSGIDRVTLNASGVVDFSEIPTAPTAAPGSTGNQIANLDFVLANSMSLSGNQAFTGIKTGTSTNSTNTGLTLTNEVTTTGSFVVDLYNSVSAGTNSTGAIRVTNSNTGGATSAIQIVNSSTGLGSFLKNISTGKGQYSENVSTGVLAQYNSLTASTGDLINFSKQGVLTAKVNSDGEFTVPKLITTGVVRLKNYTVATLPAGTQGDTAYVTDATAPTYLTPVVGGGSVVCPVFYNGTTWVCH